MVGTFYDPGSFANKSNQYLYIHVTGSSYYIWASGDTDNFANFRPKISMGISSSMTLMFYPTLLKSNQHLTNM